MAAKKPKTKKGPKKLKPGELAGSRVKLKFRRHYLPPLMGLLVAVLVFGFFYSELLSGKIAYFMYQRNAPISTIDNAAAATVVDKNAPPQLLINKINVTAPIVFNQTTVNEAAFQKALRSGVVHYPDTAVPGQQGNVVVFGHSSGQWWAPGDYKFIFTLLDKVKASDKIFLDYQGTRYIYQVSNTMVVPPTDLSVLNQGGNYMLTLITCTPVGTSAKRLIVQAQQISPKPNDNTAFTKPVSLPAEVHQDLPGNSPSFWHNLLELF